MGESCLPFLLKRYLLLARPFTKGAIKLMVDRLRAFLVNSYAARDSPVQKHFLPLLKVDYLVNGRLRTLLLC